MQKSLFDEENNIFTPSGVIRVSNNLIRGRGKVNKRAVNRGGKKVYVSETTVNDKRIEDTCIEIFQAEEITSKLRIDHKNLEKEALDYLLPLFEEYDLVEKEENSKKLNEQIINTGFAFNLDKFKDLDLDKIQKSLDSVKKLNLDKFQKDVKNIQNNINQIDEKEFEKRYMKLVSLLNSEEIESNLVLYTKSHLQIQTIANS